MKIAEARKLYSRQIIAYREQQVVLSRQKQELENKMNSELDGKTIYANEAAILELTIKAVNEKQTEYTNYMDKLFQQRTLTANMISAGQQSESAKDYIADIGKIMEVARRLMKGAVVPPTDEKKLMEYSMELYQAAKNMGALAKQREKEEKYDSLWDEDEEKGKQELEDPMEIADSREALLGAPEIVDVEETVASVT